MEQKHAGLLISMFSKKDNILKDQFLEYLQEPNLENFVTLRNIVLSAKGFDPYSTELFGVPSMMESGNFEGAVRLIGENLWPNHFLSPDVHLKLGFAHHKMGNEKEAEMERMISVLLLQGIELTGDGTKENPYLVLRTSDEFDFLSTHELTFRGQALIKADGRKFDVISVEEQDDVWFDITEIYDISERRLNLK